MALIEIPVNSNLESQRLHISLDNVFYTLRFYWNIRQESWQMDIIDFEDVVLIQGIKIVSDWLPFHKYAIENLPEGDFIVVDTTGGGTQPERTEFGLDARVKLVYQEALT